MKILFIYRHPEMGFSVGKVFRPIENEMKKYAEVASLYMPIPNYSVKGLWRNIATVRKVIEKNNYDVIHITGTEHYLLPFLWNRKVVVTVHDLGHFFNLHGVRKMKFWIMQVFSLKFAKAVTCISDFTVKELNKAMAMRNDNVCVIPNQIDDSFLFKEKAFNETCPIILHIGTRPHKNLSRTIKALNGIKCELHIIGPISDYDLELLKDLHVNYKSLANLSDEKLLCEYYTADIINFPSLHEGFGMPIIEGQAVGRIVVTSDMEPMKSVAGAGAVFCDPYAIDSIRDAYIKILKSPKYRAEIIERGKENVKKYRLSFITKQYFDLYNTL